MSEVAVKNFPRDSKGDFPPELELAALGVLLRLAKERGLLIGKPFELADAQALLTLLEVALPTVVAKLTERAKAHVEVTDADKGEAPGERDPA